MPGDTREAHSAAADSVEDSTRAPGAPHACRGFLAPVLPTPAGIAGSTWHLRSDSPNLHALPPSRAGFPYSTDPTPHHTMSTNAHGPNEFLHIPMGKELTCRVAAMLQDHLPAQS